MFYRHPGPHRGFALVKLLVLLAGLAVLIGVLPAVQTMFTPRCLDAWELSDSDRISDWERHRGEEYDRKLEIVKRRIQQKEQAITNLLAGRLSLLETAAWFKYLNERLFDMCPNVSPLPEKSPEEQYCHQVIQWAKTHQKHFPASRDQALIQRLDRELAALVARPVPIRLPTVEE